MTRMGGLSSAGLRAASILGLALLVAATPRPASAQAAAPPQEADPFKFTKSTPVMILIQVHQDKTADFESAWAAMRAGLAKSTDDQIKSFGESQKVYKVDPPIDAQKAVLYILQIDSPSTSISYNPFKTIYEILWKAGEGSILKREEADDIYNKLKAAFQSINPPWTITKIG